MERWIESGSEIARLSAEGTATYWTGALARGAAPWDVFDDVRRWWTEANRRERPRWYSPNEIVLECPVARLRDFSQGSKADVVPTLVLPPQAGHDSCIVDFSPAQSQMKVIRAAGLERAFSLEWIGATAETADAGIEDYLSFVERSIEHIGGPVNLIGDCQGGWLAAIYAALHPEHVNTLTLAGAPIDFHDGERRDRRLGRGARQRRPRVLPLGGRAGRRRAQGRAHAQRLHPDQAGERGRQADPAAARTCTTPTTSSATTTSRRGSSTCRTSRARSTSGSSSTCSWRTASWRARWRSAASASTSGASTARCSCSAARATTSRRPRRCSPRPTTSAPRPPTSRST